MTLIAAEHITRTVLPNGLTVMVRPSPGSGSVAIYGYVKAGSLFDEDRPGLARFVASALLHGTAHRSAQQIAEELDGRGASLVVIPGLDVVAVTGRALADDLLMLLGLLAEVLNEPAFLPGEVEKVRGRLITTARVDALDTRYAAEQVFRRLAYPEGHPHAQAPDGDEQMLASLGSEDLRAFHGRRCLPEAMMIAIVGDVDAGRAIDAATDSLGAWQPSGGWVLPAFPPPQPRSGPLRQDVTLPGKTQSDLLLGASGVARTHPDYYATMMANLLLGQLGMMGRVGQNVRERQGMAYYAFSEMRAGLLAGPWWVRAGVNPANVERAVAAILHEITTLQRDGPEDGELADERTFLIGSLAVRLESNQGVAQILADMELFGLGLDYLERYPSIIRAVERDHVVRAVRRFPVEGYVLAVAGPEPGA